jgi:thiol-disulfide isomerase/thioredoxin
MKPDDTLSVFVTTNGNYMASAQGRQYVHWPLPVQTGTGDYSETMLEYFILERILHPFVDVPNDQVEVIQAVDHYKLIRQTGESSSRELVIDKRTYLPIRYTASIRDKTYDLEQLQIVALDYTSTPVFPVVVEKLAGYLQRSGYAYVRPEAQAEEEKEAKPATMNERQAGQLLHYHFLSAKGDSMQLASNKSSYLLLDFWHTSCLPCLKSMPAVNALASKYKEHGLDVIGINCLDLDKRVKVGAKMSAQSPAIQYFFGERSILFEVGIPYFPMYCLVYPDRSVQYIYGGASEVEALLANLFD